MTDAQFGILIAALGSFGAALVGTIRWAVNRITKSLDDNTTSHLNSAIQMASLIKSVEFSYQASRDVKDFMVEERSGVHDVIIGPEDPTPPPRDQGYRRPATPARGTDVVKIPLRKRSHQDTDED